MPRKSNRTDPFYARVKPGNKNWLFQQMEREGFESMSLWFDQLIEKMRDHVAPKTKRKKLSGKLH